MVPGGGYSVLVLITFPSFNASQEGDHEGRQGPSCDLMIHKVIFTGSTEEDLQLAKVSRVCSGIPGIDRARDTKTI